MTAVVIIFCIIAILFGFLFAFFGYKYFRILIGLCALAVVGLLVYFLCAVNGVPFAWLIGLLSGAAAGLLAYFFYVIGLFICGFSLGSSIGTLICLGFGIPTAAWYGWLLVIALGIVFGILVVKLRRVLIIISTGFFGASLMVGGIWSLTGDLSALAAVGDAGALFHIFAGGYSAQPVWAIVSLALTVVAIVVQFVKTAPKGDLEY